MKEKRFEILGILIVTVSILILFSFFGYNSNEDPGISPNVKVENPMGILGVWLSYFFIKLGLGYSAFFIPLLSTVWGIWFFMHKDFEAIVRPSLYGLLGVLLSSISLGYLQIVYYGFDNLSFPLSGMTGGLIAILFYDFLGNIGSLLLIIALWLVLIRSYFGFSYYKPIKNLYSKLEKKRADKKLVNENLITEQEKKDHTQSLLTKIEEQRKKDLPLDQPDKNSDN